MKTIRPADVDVLRFPDSQTHVRLGKLGLMPTDTVRLVWPIRSNDELVLLMQVAQAISGIGATKGELVIPYLMGARSDREMEPGGSVDILVVADCVNRCEFPVIHLFDVHSEVSLKLIRNSRSHDNRILVKAYQRENALLIIPDAGAAKKVGRCPEWNPLITETITCDKSRDPSNGRITLTVNEPGKANGRHCVIVDDLCDGGATFIAIADQVRAAASPLSMTLIVSHGIFSKGFEQLRASFDRIITSDSYGAFADPELAKWQKDFLTVVPLNL